ncbi:MAG: DUF115 domain-containing protein [Treponema sp.]|nr:DUF115 domain-containing protein [Treponema sp.]
MEERPLIRDGKTLISSFDPVRRADKLADAVCIKDRTLYFCPSPLYGYGLARLLSRLETDAPNSAVLCTEADSELYKLSAENMPSSLLVCGRLRLTDIRGETELCSLVREVWGGRTFRRIEIIRFTGGWQLFPQVYDSLFDALRQEIATNWSNALVLTKLGRLYIRNAIRNLALLPSFPSIENLSFGERPVLLLGAGPSLDETLNEIVKRFSVTKEERLFKIICVDTSLGALRDRGIVPDLVVILESQHWNLRDFIGCSGWNAAFAADFSALPASVKILEGNGYLFFTPWTQMRIFDRLKKAGLLPAAIPPLGSVGLSAAVLCLSLTKGKIICSGLDFSFTFDKYHARGTPGHRSRLNTQTRLRGLCNAAPGGDVFTLSSKSGTPVYSSRTMMNYRNLFQREFGGNPRFFDIEGSGLPLGVKTLSMDEAMETLQGGISHVEEKKGIAPESNSTGGKNNFSECGGEEENNKNKLKENLLIFINSELDRLVELKGILSGEAETDKERLTALIDECDYLWAHFPDYAGKDERPVLGDISFLKRVRAEIEPMIKLQLNNKILIERTMEAYNGYGINN